MFKIVAQFVKEIQAGGPVQKNGEVEAQPDKPVAKTATNATSISSSAPSQVKLLTQRISSWAFHTATTQNVSSFALVVRLSAESTFCKIMLRPQVVHSAASPAMMFVLKQGQDASGAPCACSAGSMACLTCSHM